MSFNNLNSLNREQYERELEQIQKEHLEKVANRENNWRPCRHDQCTSCHGTGIKLDGSLCIHSISCSCPKCSPSFMSTAVNVNNALNGYLSIFDWENSSTDEEVNRNL